MKSDILRRAEADAAESNDDSDDAAALAEVFGAPRPSSGKGKARVVAFEEELDTLDVVQVAGDGEESGEDEGEDKVVDPRTVLELAYIADPKVFERDGATKRSEERAALRAQTGARSQYPSFSDLKGVCRMGG
jgi:activating signal cointegrator complex subunit 2